MHVYGSCREQLNASDWDAVVASEGSITTGITLNIYAQIKTRAGRNLLSAPKNVTLTNGEKLTLAINENAIKSGEDAFEIIFSAENTTASDAAQLAIIKLRDSDQTSLRTLPLSVELTLDSHFGLGVSVATSNDLPASPVNGEMRQVGASYYEYNDEAIAGDYQSGSGYWKQVTHTFNTYLSATNAIGGCDYPQSLITGLNFAPPVYPGDGSDHTPLVIWLLNGLTEDGQAQIPIGSAIAIETKLNDSTHLAASLSGGIKVRVLGYVRRSTGVLDTSIAEANYEYAWEPSSPLFNLTTALPRGYALAVEIILSFLKSQLRGGITGGEAISTILYTQGKLGTYNPVGFFTGNAIASLEDSPDSNMRILPTPGGFLRKGGLAIVDNYLTPLLGDESFAVTVADTADQQIALSGVLAGDAFIYQSGATIPPHQALRAKFSTTSGEQTPSGWSNVLTLVAGQILQLTIDHPANSEGIATIRGDYPDPLIAGLATEFTAPYFRLFLDVDGTLYQSDTLTLATQTDTQQVTVDSLTGFSVIGSLPSQADSAFGFWNYGARTLTAATGSGSLTTGVPIKFAIAYSYPSPNLTLTHIIHEGLQEIPYDLIEAITRAGAYGKVALQGSEQPARGTLDFNDPLIAISDDATNNRTRLSLPNVRRVYFSTSAPTVNDDGSAGYRQGDRWHHYTGSTLNGSYVCLSAVNGAADWPAFGTGGNGTGGHTLVDSGNNSLTQRSNLKFNNAFFSLSDDSGNDTTVINIGTTISTGAGLTGGGNHSANRTHSLSFTGLTEEQSPSNTDLLAFHTDSGIRKVTKANAIAHNHLSAQGQLLSHNGANETPLDPGTEGQYVTPDSNGDLVWADLPVSVITTTTASYVQPALDGTVLINVGSTANFIAGVSWVTIATGGHYLVTGTDTATTMTVQYKGGGVSPTTSISTNKKVTPSGPNGTDGSSPITNTSADFTVPAIDSTVVVSVADSSGFNLEVNVHIESAGNYEVTAIASDPDTITVKNLGGNNTAAGSNIASSSQIVITGPPGQDGSVSATSSLVFTNAIAPPSTTATERKVFPDSTNSNKLSLRDVSDGNISIFAFLADILPTQLTGFSVFLNPTEILATDTLLEAFGKVQKYFTDFLTNFNGINQLIKLDGSGAIPKLDGKNLTQDFLHQTTIAEVQDGTFITLALPSGFKSIRIDGIHDIKTDSNTGNLSLAKQGTAITGLDSISITTTGSNHSASGTTSNKTLSANQDLTVTLTNSDPNNPMTNLSFSIYGVYNP